MPALSRADTCSMICPMGELQRARRFETEQSRHESFWADHCVCMHGFDQAIVMALNCLLCLPVLTIGWAAASPVAVCVLFRRDGFPSCHSN